MNPEPSDPSPDSAAGAGRFTGRKQSRDERVFNVIVILAVVFIAGVVAISQWMERRTAARERIRRQIKFAEAQGPGAGGRVRQLIDFQLTNFTGQAVTRADLRGKWLIVNFVFSSCSLSCMQVNHRMTEIQSLVAEHPDVRLVSLSIDPQTDTPPVLAKFAARFQAQTNRWHLLTGPKRVLYGLIEQSFLGAADPMLAGAIPGGWSHVDHIAIVDPDGVLRGLHDGLRPHAAREVVAALAEMKREAGPGSPPSAAAAPVTNAPAPEPASRTNDFLLSNIPDFALTNEFGRPVRLRDFAGQAIAFTFFFTRCPVQEYCPRLTQNFRTASERLAALTSGPTNWHLFSISFDPADTPGVLFDYARRHHYDSNRWSFLTGPREQTDELARGFGIKVTPEGGTLSHGFATVVFDATGRLQASWPVGGDTSDGLVAELLKAAGATAAKIQP